jgi:hypothetical protein
MRMLLAALLAIAAPAAAFDHGHAAWNELLQRHVRWDADGSASAVDYAGFAADRGVLRTYLDSLSAVTPDEAARFDRFQRLAFLINAYNAFTVELVLTRWPHLTSIKDLGGLFSSPWRQRFFTLLGESRHLDDLEHGLIRGAADFDEPRVHFALNCASIGCPGLRPEAYVPESLAAQLEDQTQRFLRDRSRNRYDPDTGTLAVSRIFDWYGEDFERGLGGTRSVAGFLARYAQQLSPDREAQARVAAGVVELRFLDYDWRLNAAAR